MWWFVRANLPIPRFFWSVEVLGLEVGTSDMQRSSGSFAVRLQWGSGRKVELVPWSFFLVPLSSKNLES